MPGVISGIIGAIGAALGSIGGAIFAGLLQGILGAALSSLSMLFAAKPDKPTITARRSRLNLTVREPTRPRELILGKIRKGGTIVFIDSVNNDNDLLMAIALAGHEVQGLDEIYSFEELMVDQAGVVQSKFKGLVEFEKFLGTDTQTASTLLQNNTNLWTSDHRLRGIAYITLKLKFNRDVFNQIPNISVVTRGAKLFDTRDSTTTYKVNWALGMAHYLNNARFGLEAAYGTEIDNTALNTAANESDEDVAILAVKVLDFGSPGDEVDMGNVLNQTGDFTVEARVKPDVINKTGMKILDKDDATNGWSLFVDNDDVIFRTRGLSNVDLIAINQMVAATKKHVAAVWDAAAQIKTIYIDGVQQAQATGVTGSLTGSTAALKIGSGFDGKIQDVRLWNDPRTVSEVAAFDDKSLEGDETNLVGYWKLDEKRETIAEDATETPNDGEIKGATWVSDNTIWGSQKRYTANGVIFSDETPREVVEELLTAGMGSLIYTGGLWLVRAAAFEAPTVSLAEVDARGPIRVQPRKSRRDLFNAVRGTFISPENQYQPADFPLITNAGFETQDGGQRIVQDIELPFTTSSSRAQRLASVYLLRNREQLSCIYQAKLSGLKLRAGDFLDLTNTRFGWSGKDFEVTDWKLVQVEDEEGNPGLGVTMEMREAASAVYDFNPATDELPLDPSPNSNLPGLLGNIPIIVFFVDKDGFESIKTATQFAAWAGTITGFVKNPLTGHLNVEDQLLATGDDFNVFDQYVQTPVAFASYETPEVDIDFDDTVRTFIESTIAKGADETGSFSATQKFDHRLDAGAFGGFSKLTLARVTARRFKYRAEFDFSEGTGGILKQFQPVIDKLTIVEKNSEQTVAIGGTTFTFARRFHKVPSMSGGVKNAAARLPTWLSVTTTDHKVAVFDTNAADVGATGSFFWQAQGV